MTASPIDSSVTWAFLFLEQLDLGLLAHRDVRDRASWPMTCPCSSRTSRAFSTTVMTPVAPAKLILGVAHYAIAHQTGHDCVAVRGIHIQFARRGQGEQVVRAVIAEHPYQGRVDRFEPPVAGRAIYALDDVLEQAAIASFAAPHRLFPAHALDGDAREGRETRHQLEVALQGASRLAEVERHGADHPPVGDADGRRPARAETRGERGLAQILPECVSRDLRDHHLPLQEDRGRAGSVARGDPDLADRLEELARQPLTGDVTQGLPTRHRSRRCRARRVSRARRFRRSPRASPRGPRCSSSARRPAARRSQAARCACAP